MFTLPNIFLTDLILVVSTYKEPIKSWISNRYGATGLIAYVGLGVLRAMRGGRSCKSNTVPVDMCVNSLIAAAWDVGTAFEAARRSEKKYKILVYHYESNSIKVSSST